MKKYITNKFWSTYGSTSMCSYEILDSALVNDLHKEGFVKPAGTTVDIVDNVGLPMTVVVKPIETQNKSNLHIVVDNCSQNNLDILCFMYWGGSFWFNRNLTEMSSY